jgi:hypothetical protein
MPQIPLTPVAQPGSQEARSVPELSVRATGDAFGAGAAEANYAGAMRRTSLIGDAAKAEQAVYNTAIKAAGTLYQIVEERQQKDEKLAAEAAVNDLSLSTTGAMETDSSATGDGAYMERHLADFDKQATKLVEGAASDFQKNLLREGLQRSRFQIAQRATGAETTAIKQNRFDQISRLVDGAETGVYRDPAQLGTVVTSISETINGANFAAHEKTKLIEDASKRLYAGAIQKHLLGGDVNSAQMIMNDDRTIAALGGTESIRMQSAINKTAEDIAEKKASADMMTRIASGQQAFDPQNKEQMKMLDKGFVATGGDKLLAAGDANVITSLAKMAKEYGAVPTTATSMLNGMALSGDDAQQIFALQSVSMIEEARPGTFEVSGAQKELRSQADDFRYLTSGANGLGLTPEDAIKRIQQQRNPDFKEKAEARKTALTGKNGLLSKRTEGELADAFDQSWWSDPAIGNPRDRDVIMAAYKKDFEAHYVRTGDEQMAVKAALADMKRNYGITRLSGDGAQRLVKNPIELRVPAIDGKHDWVKEQALADIKATTGKDIPAENLFFENTRQTEESVSRGGVTTGNTPPYAFYWVNSETGLYETIPGKVFRPDVGAARNKATEAAVAQGKESARVSGIVNEAMTGVAPPSPAAAAPTPSSERTSSEENMRRTQERVAAVETRKANPAIAAGGASATEAIANVSTQLETGKADPLTGIANISRDTANTRSYGNFGLNSQAGGSIFQFQKEFGEEFGLTARPGTPEFDAQWKAAATRDPQALRAAELDWYGRNVLAKVDERLQAVGVAAAVATDQRVLAYFADRSVQQGPNSITSRKHSARVREAWQDSGGDPVRFLKEMSRLDKKDTSLASDFRRALRTGVYSRRGNNTRVNGRESASLALGGGESEGTQSRREAILDVFGFGARVAGDQ